MKSKNIRMLTLSALFAALTAIFSQLVINIGPIPINFATLSVFLAGGFLGAKYGTISQIVYVLLGIIGLPVFTNFQGGYGVIFGKTGGYIFGYILATFIVGLIADKIKKHKVIFLSVSMIIGMVAIYTLGTAWFMVVTKASLWQSLVWCVFPFIIGDLIKIAIAVIFTDRLKKVVKLK